MHNLRKLIFFAMFAPALALAQVSEPVQYAVAPEAPGPNQEVVIEMQGVGSFLGDAEITWRKDGTVVAQGAGITRYSFTTGGLGTRTNVDVAVDSPTHGTFRRTFSFNPSLVNLVWEADTTVPPLFLGKALYSAGSPLRVLALPVVYSGPSRIAASALSYRWSLNDEPLVEQSGLGRSTVSFAGDQLRDAEGVSVDVYYGNAKVAYGSVVIPAATPALVLYQRDPLRGLMLDAAFPPVINLLTSEITLQAEPFYFSRIDRAGGSLVYAWQLNGQDAAGPDAANGVLTLRQTGSGQGSAAVGVSLQNYGQDTFVQQAETALQLVFGASGSLLNNLFGL